MTKVFIVILNWNRPEDTIECLDSINGLIVKNYSLSVLVIDNGSTDDSVSKLSNYKLDNGDYKLLVNKENKGYAEGNNIGLKHAVKKKADYVMVLNNDTIVGKNLVTGLLNSIKGMKQVGMVSPKMYFAKGYEFHKKKYNKEDLGKVIWYAGGKMDWNNILGSNFGVDEVDKGQFEKVRETDFSTGACSLINVKALKDVGFFDERFFLYLEDADLSQRMKKKGWKVLYSPKGSLWHKVAQSSAIGSSLNDYYISRNRLLFGTLYAPSKARLALLRESFKLVISGRNWQRKGVIDFYLGRFGKGNWK